MLSLPPTHQKRHRSARRNRAPAPPVHFRCVIVTRLGKCLLNTGLSPAMRNLFEEGSPVEKTRNSDAKIIVTKQFCRLIAGFAQLADERRQVYFATASCGVEMFVADYVIVAIFSPVDKLRESAQQRAMQIYDALATAHGADVMAAASDDQAEYEEGSHAYTPQSATKDDDTIDSEVVTERVYRDFESSFVRAVLADTSTLPSSPARDVTPPMQRRMSSVRRQSTPPRERDVASVSVSAPASASVTADTRARDTSPSMQHRISSVRRQSTPTRDGESTNIVLAMARDQTDQTPQQPAKARDETPQQQPAMARDETPQQPAFAARDETPQQPAFAARDQTPQQPAMARDETPQQQQPAMARDQTPQQQPAMARDETHRQPAMARDQSPPPSMARRQSSVRRHTTPTRQEERGDSVAATPAREVSPPMTRRVSSVRRQSATPTREERAPLPPRDGSPSMSRRQSSVRRQSTPTREDAGRDQSPLMAGRSTDVLHASTPTHASDGMESHLSPSMEQRRASVRRQSTPTRSGDSTNIVPQPPALARDQSPPPSMARRQSSVRRHSTPTRVSFQRDQGDSSATMPAREMSPPMTRRVSSVRRQSTTPTREERAPLPPRDGSPSLQRRQSSVRRQSTPTRVSFQGEQRDSIASTPAREMSPPMARRVSSVRRQSVTPTREERAPLPPRDGSPSMSRRQSSVRRQSTPTRGDAGRDQSAGRSEDAERNLSPSMMQRRASVRRQSTPTRDGRDVSPAMARRISSVRRQTTPLRSDDGELIPAPPSMARDVRDASPSMARRVSSVRRQSTPTRASVASTNSSSDQLFRLPPLPTASAASQRNDSPPMTRRTVSVRRQSASLRDAAAVDQVPERQPQQQHQQQQERIPLPKTLPPLNVPQSDSVPTSTTATQNHVTSPKDVSLPMELPISLDELRPHKPHLPAQSPISVSRSPATTHSSASRKLFGDESLVSRTAVTAPVAETPQRVAVVDSAANDSVELSPMEESFGSPDGLSLATTGELYDGVFTIQPSPVPKHREFRSFIVPPTPSLRDAAVRLPSRSKQPVVSVVSDSGSDFADDAPSVAQQSRFVRRRSLREATSVPAAIKPAPPASEPPPSMAALRSRQLAQLMSSGANLPTLSPAAAAVPVDTPPGSPMMISPAPPPRSSISPKRVGFNAGYSPARFDMKSAVPESQQPFASPLIQRSPSPESKALMFTSVAFQATPTSAPRRKSVVALSSEQQVRVS